MGVSKSDVASPPPVSPVPHLAMEHLLRAVCVGGGGGGGEREGIDEDGRGIFMEGGKEKLREGRMKEGRERERG